MRLRIPGVVYRRLDDLQQPADLLLVSRNGEGGGAVRTLLGIARQALAD